jgi:hypothetical protein
VRPTDRPVQKTHLGWCDPDECLADQDGSHPSAPMPMHLSRRFPTQPRDPHRITDVTVQLVQFVGHPAERLFVRLWVEEIDAAQAFYIELHEGEQLRDALIKVTALPAANGPSRPGPESSG